MVNQRYNPQDNLNLLRSRVDELRVGLVKIDPVIMADRTGSHYLPLDQEAGEYHLPMWGRDIIISCPEYIARDGYTKEELSVSSQALVMYHFVTTDGTPEIEQWISFTDLPDGRFYSQAFQGYTGQVLARAFNGDRARFEVAAKNIGGEHQPLGDACFVFQLLPRISLLAVLWEWDEDFPASFRILFNALVAHHLPTDACAIAGSMLTRRLIAAD